ncbi:CLUMA_CG017820, isoform A [Clunio marinus]|uniref:CLUMA_CG017820, isoform A n=1 Tax=Clunio marinus TaxID=568069 RepID=A0A1J1IXD1_9DIPT|nr:CLUMA_CG017820, isoform A [Clunio marinus]
MDGTIGPGSSRKCWHYIPDDCEEIFTGNVCCPELRCNSTTEAGEDPNCIYEGREYGADEYVYSRYMDGECWSYYCMGLTISFGGFRKCWHYIPDDCEEIFTGACCPELKCNSTTEAGEEVPLSCLFKGATFYNNEFIEFFYAGMLCVDVFCEEGKVVETQYVDACNYGSSSNEIEFCSRNTTQKGCCGMVVECTITEETESEESESPETPEPQSPETPETFEPEETPESFEPEETPEPQSPETPEPQSPETPEPFEPEETPEPETPEPESSTERNLENSPFYQILQNSFAAVLNQIQFILERFASMLSYFQAF